MLVTWLRSFGGRVGRDSAEKYPNVCFNIWIRAMSRMNKLDLRTHSMRDEELRKRLRIESLDEILGRGHINWVEKVAHIMIRTYT